MAETKPGQQAVDSTGLSKLAPLKGSDSKPPTAADTTEGKAAAAATEKTREPLVPLSPLEPVPDLAAAGTAPTTAEKILTVGSMLAFSLAGDSASAVAVGNALIQRRQAARDIAFKQAGLQARFEQEARLRARLTLDVAKEGFDQIESVTREGRLQKTAARKVLTDQQKAAITERDTKQKVYTTALTGLRTDVEQLTSKMGGISIGALGKSLLEEGFRSKVALSSLIGKDQADEIFKGTVSGETQQIIQEAMTAGIELNHRMFDTKEEALAMRDQVASELAGLFVAHLSTLVGFPELQQRFLQNAGHMMPSQKDAVISKARAILAPEQSDDTTAQSTEAGADLPALSSEEVFHVVKDFGTDLALALTDSSTPGALGWGEWNDLATTVLAVMKMEGLEAGALPEKGAPARATYNDVLMHLDDQIEFAILKMDADEPFPDEASKDVMRAQIEGVMLDFLETGVIPVEPPPLVDTPVAEAPHVARAKVRKGSKAVKGQTFEGAARHRRAAQRAPKSPSARSLRSPKNTPLIGRRLGSGTSAHEIARLQEDSIQKAETNQFPGIAGGIKQLFSPDSTLKALRAKAHEKTKATNPRRR